jgi:hypothetical protein
MIGSSFSSRYGIWSWIQDKSTLRVMSPKAIQLPRCHFCIPSSSANFCPSLFLVSLDAHMQWYYRLGRGLIVLQVLLVSRIQANNRDIV